MASSGGATSSRSPPPLPEWGQWLTEVAPRVGLAGVVVGGMVVDRMTLQVANTSQGRMPTPKASHRWDMLKATIGKQAGIGALQYAFMREIKLFLDQVQPSPAFSLMIACSVTGVPCSSLAYNWSIQDTYRYFAMPPPEVKSVRDFLRQQLMPGLLWSFVRAGAGTGGGLYFGPYANGALDGLLRGRGLELPAGVTRLASGLAMGAASSLATQGVHNVTLVCGRMAALGATEQAPHYTTVALRAAWKEMGFAVFYKNYGPRMAINAVTVATLSWVDVFHRPELSRWSCLGSR